MKTPVSRMNGTNPNIAPVLLQRPPQPRPRTTKYWCNIRAETLVLTLLSSTVSAQESGSGSDALSDYFFPIAGMIFVLCIIAMNLYAAYRTEKKRHELLSAFISADREIPAELLPPTPAQAEAIRRHEDIRRGIWMLSWGVGIAMALVIYTGEIRMAAWSLIFLLLAAGSFFNAFVLSRPKQELSARPPRSNG